MTPRLANETENMESMTGPNKALMEMTCSPIGQM